MEIFNNIWTALSTPNEGLVNIFSIPCTFIEIALGMLLFTFMLKIKSNRKQKVIYIILASLFALFTTHFISSPYNVILNYVLLFITIITIFKTNLLKTILAVILPSICITLLSVLILNPFIKLMHIDYVTIQYVPIYRFLYLSIIYVIIFSVSSYEST